MGVRRYLAARRERRDKRKRALAGVPVLGNYTGTSWIQRHRRLCYWSLAIFSAFYGFAFGIFGSFFLLQMTVPLIPLALIVIWCLPETDNPPEKLLERLCFTYVIALLCWPDYLAIALPGLPWITVIRLVAVPLVLTLLICLSVSPSFRKRQSEVLSSIPVVWMLVIVLTVLVFGSIALSKSPMLSLNKAVVMLLNWTAMFFIGAAVFARPGRMVRLAYTLWGITMFVGVIGIYEVFYSRVPWAGRIPSFLRVDDEAVQRILTGAARAATGIYRVQSKFTTSLTLAEFLGFSVPFLLHIIFTTRRKMVRILGGLSMPFICYIVVKTDSRLGMTAFFMSLLLYLLAWGVMRWRASKESLFGPAVTISYPVSFIGFIIATFYVGRLRALVWGTGAQAASTETRKQMYNTGIPMVMRNPIGHGWGRAAETLGFYNGAGVLTIDTYYLSIALEIGVVGFLVFYGMFVIAIIRAGLAVIKTHDPEVMWLVPIGIALSNFLLSKSVLSQQENHPFVFLLLGAAVALIWRSKTAASQAIVPVEETRNEGYHRDRPALAIGKISR